MELNLIHLPRRQTSTLFLDLNERIWFVIARLRVPPAAAAAAAGDLAVARHAQVSPQKRCVFIWESAVDFSTRAPLPLYVLYKQKANPHAQQEK